MLNNLLNTLNIPFLLQVTIATLSSFFICFFGINFFLKIAQKKNTFYQPIRSDGPSSHLEDKKHTPTMGGLIIVLTTLIVSILFTDIKNNYILITLFIFLSFAAIGFIDDFIKISKKNSKGFKGSIKIIIQFVIIGISLFWLQNTNQIYSQNITPLPFANYYINLGIFYIFFVFFAIIGSANAVNLTDGLDGLVSVPTIINLICLSIIIYAVGDKEFAYKLRVTNIKNASDLIIFCLILVGAITAFLKFNLKPAKIFMGDVGSLPIGAALGTIAVIIRQELIFAIISLLFVIEALSVILQVASYKIRKKRIFLMAPIHHHFEKLGWKEEKVVKVFWLWSLIFAIIGLLGLVINFI